ncbi:hypothetical protein BO443_20007 [Burkholderia orbicola]
MQLVAVIQRQHRLGRIRKVVCIGLNPLCWQPSPGVVKVAAQDLHTCRPRASRQLKVPSATSDTTNAMRAAVRRHACVENPADEVGVASIATFVPKDRVLSPLEIRLVHRQLEQVATYPTIRLALRLILLTMVRKSELIDATWDEVDFEAAVWTIPKSRMNARRAHNIYLSRQSIDIMVALHVRRRASRRRWRLRIRHASRRRSRVARKSGPGTRLSKLRRYQVTVSMF